MLYDILLGAVTVLLIVMIPLISAMAVLFWKVVLEELRK